MQTNRFKPVPGFDLLRDCIKPLINISIAQQLNGHLRLQQTKDKYQPCGLVKDMDCTVVLRLQCVSWPTEKRLASVCYTYHLQTLSIFATASVLLICLHHHHGQRRSW